MLRNNLLRLVLEREVEFTIKLALGIMPILKASYKITLAKLYELKKKLQELLDNGFIRPTHLLWGTNLICKKER